MFNCYIKFFKINDCLGKTLELNDPNDTTVPQLSDAYSIVQPADVIRNDLFVPGSSDLDYQPSSSFLHGAKVKDESRISHVSTVLKQENLNDGEVITWSG